MCRTVDTVLTREVVCAHEDTHRELVKLLAGRRVSAVPVVDDHRHVLRPGDDIDDDLSPALAKAFARQGCEPWRTGAGKRPAGADRAGPVDLGRSTVRRTLRCAGGGGRATARGSPRRPPS
jgi:hypothetical protein